METEPQETVAVQSAGRDSRGRFLPGSHEPSQFVKGKSGNPSGRPKSFLTDAMKRAFRDADVRMFAETIKEMALDGDLKAMELILDRFEGKPLQQQHLTGEVRTGPIQEIVMHAPAEGDSAD